MKVLFIIFFRGHLPLAYLWLSCQIVIKSDMSVIVVVHHKIDATVVSHSIRCLLSIIARHDV